MKAQGWYRDPYGVHQDRYFSAGQPTKLVRDGRVESYDPPPRWSPEEDLVEVTADPQTGSGCGDLRRADERAAGPATYEKDAAFWAAIDGIV